MALFLQSRTLCLHGTRPLGYCNSRNDVSLGTVQDGFRSPPRQGSRSATWKVAGQRRVPKVSAIVSSASSTSNAASLVDWLLSSGFPKVTDIVRIKDTKEEGRDFIITAAKTIKPGEVIFNIPENFSVTALDVGSHPVLSPAASENSNDLALLALWLLWETAQGDASPWAPYVRTFTAPVLSPLLWSSEERSIMLKGYSGLQEIESRLTEINSFYQKLYGNLLGPQASVFPSDSFSPQRFREAFVSVLSRAIFLPEAGLFALVPIADLIRHGLTSSNAFQYSPEGQSVIFKADRPIEPGQEVLACRTPQLSNFEMALQFGEVFQGNPNDFVSYATSLVPTDPLLMIKKQILQEEGFSESTTFPLFADRFPRQLLSYLRLARVQDAAQFAKVTFKADIIVNESNEYEVLMLVLNECKERLQDYPQALEDDIRLVRGTGNAASSPSPIPSGLLQSLGAAITKTEKEADQDVAMRKERLAAQLRASEKTILNNTVTALRARLAPIRGVPTKSGMGDPNSEIKEVFEMMEMGLSAPKRIFSDIFKKQK